jgi:uncharacterized protein (TIGR00369 family)
MNQSEMIHHYINHPMHKPLNMSVALKEKSAKITMSVHSSVLNFVGILHGSIYFKLMDDACFFAVIATNQSSFVVTSNMTVNYIKPVSEGMIITHASVITKRGRLYLCESHITNLEGSILAHATGSFIEPKTTYEYKKP